MRKIRSQETWRLANQISFRWKDLIDAHDTPKYDLEDSIWRHPNYSGILNDVIKRLCEYEMFEVNK